MATMSQKGLALIQSFEGCRLVAYQDSSGVWTIGWGHTGLVDGASISPSMTITQEKADQLLQADLLRFEQGVEGSLTHPATQDQFDAFVAFSYNVGLGAFRGSTLLRLFNLGDPHGSALQFIEWSHDATGNVLLGLARRRCAEIVRFYGG